MFTERSRCWLVQFWIYLLLVFSGPGIWNVFRLNESLHESIKLGSGPDELPHEPVRLVSGPQLVWICAPYLDWSGCASGLDIESVCYLGYFVCTIGIFFCNLCKLCNSWQRNIQTDLQTLWRCFWWLLFWLKGEAAQVRSVSLERNGK